MFRSIAILTLCLATVTAQGALLSRAGGQAYYDDVLDITWLADANYVVKASYGVNYNPTTYFYGGRMSWFSAVAWIAAMNASNGGNGYLGANDWRLPTVTDTGAQGCVRTAYSGTDCGFNVDLTTSELAHLYYSTLGNVAAVNPNGTSNPCEFTSCLANTGPFSFGDTGHIAYWTSTSSAVESPTPNLNSIWTFVFQNGEQRPDDKVSLNFALPVLDGDALAVIPIPAAFWLFGSALGVMGVMRRKLAS